MGKAVTERLEVLEIARPGTYDAGRFLGQMGTPDLGGPLTGYQQIPWKMLARLAQQTATEPDVNLDGRLCFMGLPPSSPELLHANTPFNS